MDEWIDGWLLVEDVRCSGGGNGNKGKCDVVEYHIQVITSGITI